MGKGSVTPQDEALPALVYASEFEARRAEMLTSQRALRFDLALVIRGLADMIRVNQRAD